jgi:hypothetical protein
MQYELIRTDGSRTEVFPAGDSPSLEELQEWVGGYIQMVEFDGGKLYMDEDGLFKQLPVNQVATELVHAKAPGLYVHPYGIVGNVLLESEPIPSDRYYPFLDALRESAITNMFGAAPYLQVAFGLTKSEAKAVLKDWMATFGERHPKRKCDLLIFIEGESVQGGSL